MIPKKIHYCWFGGNDKLESVMKCIESWKNICQIMRLWSGMNLTSILKRPTSMCVRHTIIKKWAFVTDYVRLIALYENGGIYFDTDVEVFKSFDSLLSEKAFFGFESKDYLCTAVIACEKGNSFIKKFIDSYENRKFILSDGSFDTATTNVVAVTRMLLSKGLRPNGKMQIVDDVTIYPQYYFQVIT